MSHELSRRRFLELSTATAGAVAGSGLATPALGKTAAFRQINPAIPNSKVVCCIDPGMVTKPSAVFPFSAQVDAVDNARVQTNMDGMAMALTGKTTAGEAWATIFRRGSKEWSQIKVAIKVNCQADQTSATPSVIGGVCRGLIGLGVKPANIFFYDGSTNAQAATSIESQYAPFIGAGKPIPAGVKAVRSSLTRDAQGRVGQITTFIADGSTDIVINLANNKGHTFVGVGCVTLTMKNHYGTYHPAIYTDHDKIDNLILTSKRDDLVGGDPPRQQLCIVDSLWAVAARNNFSAYDKCPSCILMGTVSGVVDYVTVKKIRGPIMGCPDTDGTRNWGVVVPEFIKGFDVTATDVEAQYTQIGRVGADASGRGGAGSDAHEVSIHVVSDGAFVTFPVAAGTPYRIAIATLDGRTMRTFAGTGGPGQRSLWDGKDETGRRCARGTYAVQCASAGRVQASTLQLR